MPNDTKPIQGPRIAGVVSTHRHRVTFADVLPGESALFGVVVKIAGSDSFWTGAKTSQGLVGTPSPDIAADVSPFAWFECATPQEALRRAAMALTLMDYATQVEKETRVGLSYGELCDVFAVIESGVNSGMLAAKVDSGVTHNAAKPMPMGVG